jgi:hypothetical protein
MSGTDRHWVGNNDFAAWVKNMESTEVRSADDLHAYCEQGRGASQYVSVVQDQFAADLRIMFRDADRSPDPKTAAENAEIGFDPHYDRRFRGVVREMAKVSDAYEAAAKHLFAAWLKFEKAAVQMDSDRKEAVAKHRATAKQSAPAATGSARGFKFSG